MANPSIPIQNDLRPAYYDDFHCLAGDCRWNCCKGWRISFDKKDYLSLTHDKYSPEISTKIEQGIQRIRKNNPIDGHYAEIRLRGDSVCPFQREDGLCALQVEKGPKILPFVCKIFPRTEVYCASGYFERSLSLACEGVVSLLWDLPDGIYFSSDPLPKEQRRSMTFPQGAKMSPYFQEIRSVFIDYLQDRRFPLPARILMIGLAVQELQTAEDIPGWLAFARALPESSDINRLLEINHSDTILEMFIINNMKVLLKINPVDPESISLRADVLNALGIQLVDNATHMQINNGSYLNAREKYAKVFADRDYFMENVMVAVFFHLNLPALNNPEDLWKSYVNFCSLYSFYRFMTVFSCREGVADETAELIRLIVMVSRSMLHNSTQQTELRDEFFENDSTTLGHMAVLLSE